MSLSLSGNDFKHQSYVFPIEEQSHIGEVRRFAAVLCEKMDFDETRQGRVAIVINELGSNLLKYSSKGQILIRSAIRDQSRAIEILSIDAGPGIQSTSEAMTDGFSTGSSPGTGLGAIQRQSDHFDIYSDVGKGTIVVSIINTSNNQKPTKFLIGAVGVPIKGERVSGDDWCVSETRDFISVMMIDGLGHGPIAHKAACEAIDEFHKNKDSGVQQILTSIHNRLRSTRGGAVFVTRCDADFNIEYVSVGNIRAIAQSAEAAKTLISQNGTAGLRVPTLKVFNQSWDGRGFFVLHSDGINSRWNLSNYPGIFNHHPAVAAALIYRDFNRGTDDSTVLVIGRER